MSDVRGTVWADWEVDAIVADYFNMLSDDTTGTTYNKSEHRRALHDQQDVTRIDRAQTPEYQRRA